MTVSATQEAKQAATAASAALPPSSRISTPASTVAGWPAATAAFTFRYPTARPRPRPSVFLGTACGDRGVAYLRRNIASHQGREAGDRRQARQERLRHGLPASPDRADDRAYQRAHRAPPHASQGSLLAAGPAQAR